VLPYPQNPSTIPKIPSSGDDASEAKKTIQISLSAQTP
jgi:hypothetical protein